MLAKIKIALKTTFKAFKSYIHRNKPVVAILVCGLRTLVAMIGGTGV